MLMRLAPHEIRRDFLLGRSFQCCRHLAEWQSPMRGLPPFGQGFEFCVFWQVVFRIQGALMLGSSVEGKRLQPTRKLNLNANRFS